MEQQRSNHKTQCWARLCIFHQRDSYQRNLKSRRGYCCSIIRWRRFRLREKELKEASIEFPSLLNYPILRPDLSDISITRASAYICSTRLRRMWRIWRRSWSIRRNWWWGSIIFRMKKLMQIGKIMSNTWTWRSWLRMLLLRWLIHLDHKLQWKYQLSPPPASSNAKLP